MKTIFPGYYRPTEDEFSEMWKTCFFAFDASILLNLYSYSEETRDEIFKILEKLSDRIWIPHQTAYEYQKNRVGKIEEQSGTYKSILGEISKSKNKITGALSSKVHPFVRDTSETIGNLQSVFDEIIDQLEEEKTSCEKLVESDTIRRKIDTLFEGKIGSPYDEERIKEIIIEGEDRYDSEQPPGFEDEKDKIGRRKYGDLILWFQVIDKALEEKLPNILVTDEKKKDWWHHNNKNEIISPHPELIDEFYQRTGMGFYLYRTDRFMKFYETHAKKEVSHEAIAEVRDYREHTASMVSRLMTPIIEQQRIIIPSMLAEILKTQDTYNSLIQGLAFTSSSLGLQEEYAKVLTEHIKRLDFTNYLIPPLAGLLNDENDSQSEESDDDGEEEDTDLE